MYSSQQKKLKISAIAIITYINSGLRKNFLKTWNLQKLLVSCKSKLETFLFMADFKFKNDFFLLL